ncbi:hypothetical protein F5882DRAFT_421373 [Hyaloscypha sp. PMI_1271]|nr:hypothetical protein F5882DRAFT_421373 [Hyaloscypha sp. PMI_1271]
MSLPCKMPAIQEHIIAVMGITGAGKSTFTPKATGRKDIIISNNLQPRTKDAKEYVMEHKGRQVRLIDTPGFDDDEMSDADLLKIIGDFLGTLVIDGATLAGMILLQPVTTNRVPGSEERRTPTNGG